MKRVDGRRFFDGCKAIGPQGHWDACLQAIMQGKGRVIKKGMASWTVNHGCPMARQNLNVPCFQNVGMNGKHPLRDELTSIQKSDGMPLTPGVFDASTAQPIE